MNDAALFAHRDHIGASDANGLRWQLKGRVANGATSYLIWIAGHV